MQQDMNKIKAQIRDNINILVNRGNLQEAKALINEYKKMEAGDIEIYSMNAVIAIMEGDLETAEETINSGLKIENNNFDLLYNLAYVYEQKGEYNKALIYYKRARKLKFYESKIKIETDKIIENILQNKRDILKKECEENEIYEYLNKIQNVLFIDFNLTKEVNSLGKSLDEYGINVDLAYSGTTPEIRFSNKELVYRKLLGITNIDHLIEYIDYYCYDAVHIFCVPNNIKRYIRENSNSFVVFNDELIGAEVNELIKFYSLNKKVDNKKVKEESSNESLTILIPTYNRPKYLERVLTYFNNFKYFKPYIFVLDSSFENNKIVNEAIIKSFNNGKVKYYHFDSSINFFTKLNFGIEKIVTDYVALCADDDFLTEEGVMESVKILEKNKELYSVKGKNLYFIESMSKLKEYDFFEGLYEDNVVKRLKHITEGFVPSLIYQVFRVNKFKNMYSFLEKNISELPTNTTFSEYLFYFMVICTGKLGKFNLDLNIRDKSVPRETEIKNFPHAVIDESFNDNYRKFCGFLSKYIYTIGENRTEFDKNIPEIFINFLINFLQVPKENVIINNGEFDIKQLEIGMRKSWVWPSDL